MAARFAAWRAAGRRALIPYLTAGYPDPQETPELLLRLADAGADVLELGVPFSDPLADGATIQHASERALQRGATLAWTLDALADFRRSRETAVVLFTYLNPVLAYGVERFLRAASAAGADGVLLTDLPVGSDRELEAAFERAPLALVRLLAPTTPPARVREIARRAQGFLYYISRTGVTGARTELRARLADEVAALRRFTRVPIAVGFGISTAAQAAEVARVADGVVVGSALIDALDRGGPVGAEKFVASLRDAVDAVDQ
ncbi:MAG: tryptophan synthase subunit alpha [Gemmatimonadetes bacterium]|nr:tryptophan synthase subunit alpha [Gemmatimonadota bacterium]